MVLSSVCRKWLPVLGLTFCLTVQGSASAGLVNFDDLTVSSSLGSPISNGYQGLNWTNVYVLDAIANSYNPSGYLAAMVSPRNVAFNAFGQTAVISDGLFTFNSAYFTGAWRDGLSVHVQGFDGTTLLYDTTFLVNATAPTLETFNWSGIDSLQFSSYGGSPHSGYSNDTNRFAMDDLTFNQPVPDSVPEPTSVLIWSVLGSVGILLRSSAAWSLSARSSGE